MTLQKRILGTSPGGVVDLGDEPMGDARLIRFDGRSVKVRGGVFRTLYQLDIANLGFEETKVRFTPDKATTNNTQAVRAVGCSRVSMAGFDMVGGTAITGVDPSAARLDGSGNVIGLPAGKAINWTGCDNMSLDTGNIEGFHKGVLASKCPDSLWRRVNVSKLRTTGFTFTSAPRLLMERCSQVDSRPWNVGGYGDHADGFHSWMDAGVVMEDIHLLGNLFAQGAGTRLMGIYLDNKSGTGGGYVRTRIEDNVVHNAHAQGILLERVSGQVANNALRWSGDGVPYGNVPRIVVTAGSRDIEFEGNSGDPALQHDLISLYKLTAAERASMRYLP